MPHKPEEIPPHMIAEPHTRGQKKAFAKAKKAAEQDTEKKSEKHAAKSESPKK